MFTGCGTALVTPFRSDLSLDEEALRRLVRRQIQGGVHFLVACGTTGENPTLSKKEQLRVVEITLEEAKGKIPVVAGAGGYHTEEVVQLSRELEAMEVDGLLSVTPYYNRPTPEGLYQHYTAIAAATRTREAVSPGCSWSKVRFLNRSSMLVIISEMGQIAAMRRGTQRVMGCHCGC
jgi:4-hydroxy-tetrahydrodipicolinate synthase